MTRPDGSTWVEPTFTCGECGGQIARWPMKNLLRQDILDWRHKTVPPGVGEHRAVLGTPAHQPRVPAPTKPRKDHDEVVLPDVAPDPVVPARPAKPHELPASAGRFAKKAAENGWTTQAWYMHGPLMLNGWKFAGMVESIVLWCDREGVRVVAAWQSRVPGVPPWTARDWPGPPYVESFNPWAFDTGYVLGRTAEPAGSPELGRVLERPVMRCNACDRAPELHYSTEWGLLCDNNSITEP